MWNIKWGNSRIKKDWERYRKEVGGIFHEPSFFVVCIYRIRKSIYKKIKNRALKILVKMFLEPLYYFMTLLLGIHLPLGCEIGPGLMIYHFGGIILNSKTIIGDNCTLRHNVTIGNRRESFDVPVIGNNVEIGVGAVIIGAIKIGNNVTIGANAVVLCDVADNHIAVGNPARVIPKK